MNGLPCTTHWRLSACPSRIDAGRIVRVEQVDDRVERTLGRFVDEHRREPHQPALAPVGQRVQSRVAGEQPMRLQRCVGATDGEELEGEVLADRTLVAPHQARQRRVAAVAVQAARHEPHAKRAVRHDDDFGIARSSAR